MAFLRRHLPSLARAARGAANGGRPRILRSEVSDITFHFAVEEYLMNAEKLTAPLMYLWRPQPVVTIGRHQNPWKECVLSQLDEDGVALVRRRSGGGAIFQDAGCSVFTFLFPSGEFDIDRNLETVLGALGRLGVQAEKKGRNDLTFEDKKISGSAFKHAPDRGVSLHHGTVLVDTDLTALQRYLTPDKRKLQAKGIASVGARVMNLKEKFPEVSHDKLCDALVAEFREREGAQDAEIEEIDENSEMAQDLIFLHVRGELQNKEWHLGKTPEFSHQFETRIDGVGVFDVNLKVVQGRIEEVTIFSDALFPDVISESMNVLKGVEYGKSSVSAVLAMLRMEFDEPGPLKTLDSLSQFMVSSIEE